MVIVSKFILINEGKRAKVFSLELFVIMKAYLIE